MAVLHPRRRIVGLVLTLLVVAATGADAPAGAAVQEPAAGLDHVVVVITNTCKSLALRADGTVWGWGCNSDWDFGAAGPGAAQGDARVVTPIQATGLDHVRAIAAGVGHGLAVRADGTVWAWGLDDHGQVGVPPGEDCPFHARPCIQAPVPVLGLNEVTAVAATDYGSFALKVDGTVWAWGEGRQGQLGTGRTTDTRTPTLVQGLSNVVHVSAFGTRVVALRADGTVWTWGGSDDQTTPTQVRGLADVAAVSAGFLRHVARTVDGRVWVWGDLDHPTPAPVAGLGPMVAIAGGSQLSGAVAADGTVWTWGASSPTGEPEPPIQAEGLSDIVAIDMHLEGNVALTADGTVWTWRQFGAPKLAPAPAIATPTP